MTATNALDPNRSLVPLVRLLRHQRRQVRGLAGALGLWRGRKIFVVGMNKTGTTSIHRLLSQWRYDSFHGPHWADVDNLRFLSSYECFSDGEAQDFDQLDRLFPGSKFILQVRALDAWVESRLAHIQRRKAAGRATTRADWDDTDDAVEQWIRFRNAYHAALLNHFANRDKDFMVINFVADAQAVAHLGAFLEKPASTERPHTNINRDSSASAKTKNKEVFARAADHLNLTRDERSYDILCPSLLPEAERERLPWDTRAACTARPDLETAWGVVRWR